VPSRQGLNGKRELREANQFDDPHERRIFDAIRKGIERLLKKGTDK